ncbi:MAG: guanylate kinase [Lachnospiraceae bacterium]|jgi:guanylate kinase|nr:guanylate kinase [Lachnospiraceae bacterium]
MGKIFYIIGKSSTGKDTIYKRLLADQELNLKPIVIYTTRPIREGERQGREYFFTDEEGLEQIRRDGKLIELRAYDTIFGVWKYFTADYEQIDLGHEDYLMIGVLDSFHAVREYYGWDRVIPVYIEVEDGERLQRALNRERQEQHPKYKELCRRFLTDSEDFSEEKIQAEQIGRRFYNRELEDCVKEIRVFILDTCAADRK